MPEFTGTKDIRSYLTVLWRWKLLFLAFLIAVPLATWLLERGKPNVYTAHALVGVNQTTVNTSLLSGGGSFSTTNVTAIAQIVTTTPVATAAADRMHPPADPGQIVSEVSASGDPATNFLTITATDHNPARAAEIANAFAQAISANLAQAAVSQIQASIKGVQAQIAALTRNDPTRSTLNQQLNQLRAAEATQGSEAAILQAASAPGSPSGPHLRRTVELAVLIGLLLGFGAVALAESADRRLRTPPDLEQMTDLPVLASISPTAFSGDVATRAEDEEAFNMLRTTLTYFNIEKRLKSIVVTSAVEKEGKTTVATRLALNIAAAGQRVMLVDGDLRRAQVTAKLGIQAEYGLAGVLAGRRALDEALVDYPVEGPGAGSLQVLPAGPPPPNPSALLASDAMDDLITELESRSDIVIIDTPAALAVSDPLPIMGTVSGVVMVARMNRSSRQTIKRLQQIIESAHGKLLGVVATAVKAGPGYDHYYPKYYTTNGNGSHGRRRLGRRRKAAERAPVVQAAEPKAAEPKADEAKTDEAKPDQAVADEAVAAASSPPEEE